MSLDARKPNEIKGKLFASKYKMNQNISREIANRKSVFLSRGEKYSFKSFPFQTQSVRDNHNSISRTRICVPYFVSTASGGVLKMSCTTPLKRNIACQYCYWNKVTMNSRWKKERIIKSRLCDGIFFRLLFSHIRRIILKQKPSLFNHILTILLYNIFN